MITIRNYVPADREQLEQICLATAAEQLLKTDRDKEFLLLCYNRYYTRCCADTVFVAEEDGRVIGYVLCDTDYEKFLADFSAHELKELKKINFIKAAAFFFSVAAQKTYGKTYTAHLHIDILPGYQRKGIGHRLLDALAEKLREEQIGGVFLTVGKENEKGIRFYKNYGFEILKEFGTYIVFGLKISSKN